MKSLCETLNCFCKSTFVSNYFNHMFSSGKASSGTNAGRIPLRKRLPAVAQKGNAQQEWSAFLGAPSSPFERLPPPKPPSSLWQSHVSASSTVCLMVSSSFSGAIIIILLLLLIPQILSPSVSFFFNPTFLVASAALLTASTFLTSFLAASVSSKEC